MKITKLDIGDKQPNKFIPEADIHKDPKNVPGFPIAEK